MLSLIAFPSWRNKYPAAVSGASADEAGSVQQNVQQRPPGQVVTAAGDGASKGTMRANRCGKVPDTMRSAEMRKRRSERLSKTCRRAEDALPYSTLDWGAGP